MLRVGKPNSWITLKVRTVGFKTWQVELPGEAPNVSQEGASKRGTSGNTRPINALRVAYDSVVVMNLEPMNSGNRREGKTWGTSAYAEGISEPKAERWCEGMKENRSEWKLTRHVSGEDNSHWNDDWVRCFGGDEPAKVLDYSTE